MNSSYYIKGFSHIKNNTITLNDEVIFSDPSTDFSVFIKNAYKNFETNYSKFFKMDNLSKLAFLGADILLQAITATAENEWDIAVVLSNRASSLDSDRKHQDSIEDRENYYPSPSVFVYTLPNICIGEISIRHKLYSENSFFIFDHFNAEHLRVYANSLLESGKAKKVLCGWVDFDEDKYEAFLYLVGDEGSLSHNTEEIISLYDRL